MISRCSRKAQSTLEYIIIFTVIIGAVLLFANVTLRSKMATILNHTATQAETAVTSHLNFTG
jgi:Flp pilus assembly protein protease CpaA